MTHCSLVALNLFLLRLFPFLPLYQQQACLFLFIVLVLDRRGGGLLWEEMSGHLGVIWDRVGRWVRFGVTAPASGGKASMSTGVDARGMLLPQQGLTINL